MLDKILKIIYSLYYSYIIKECHSSVKFEKLGLLVGPKYISIGQNSSIQQYTYLTAWDSCGKLDKSPEIKIGSDCHIGAFNHITAIDKIEIGDGFVSGKWVTITDNGHGNTDYETLEIPVSKREMVSKGPVFIGRNVWIGDKATILPGVTIGDGCVIGANCVVAKDMPPYSIAVGNPAKIFSRKTDERER